MSIAEKNRTAIKNTPRLVAIFRLKNDIKFPDTTMIRSGASVYWNEKLGTFTSLKTGKNYKLPLSKLEFLSYQDLNTIITNLKLHWNRINTED